MTEPARPAEPPAPNTKNNHSTAARIVTIPNVLSISRLVLLPVVLLLLFKHQGTAAVVVMLVSWSTDALDGYLARKLGQVSNLGRVLDHLVDKVWVSSVLVTLVFIRNLPLLIAGAVILRDLVILIGSGVIMKTKGSLVSSDVVGKITGCAFALMILFYTLDLPALMKYKTAVDYTVATLIIVSSLNYFTVFLRLMARFRLPGEDSQ
ncbi:MAG: CDP-alcohol phosphatidyltransferase family protein [candidate division WOR-3 bacterium]|nr:CDP-alcohol phosphatidyltransferase family protein [candidate division WOR-3 bacterium]